METIKERLQFLASELHMSVRAFERSCELTIGYINTLNEISSANLKRIHDHYPKLSTDWLVYGEGDMWRMTADNNTGAVFQGNNSGTNQQNCIPAAALEHAQSQLDESLKQNTMLLQIVSNLTHRDA